MRLAFDEPSVLRSRTIGESWFAVAGRIVASGVPSLYDGLPIRELSLVTLAVERPDPDDEILFVDCNTPNDLPTFVEAIYDTLTPQAKARLRVFHL